MNTKGKIPIWFKDIEKEVLEDQSGSRKKRSQSKNHKRIRIHLVIEGEEIDINNSPFLKKCEGCSKNISKKKGTNERLIYLGEFSRKIERRKEENLIKPYETLNNIIKKNTWLRNYTQEDRRDIIYNERIEIIDNLIKTEEEFITLIKNSIFENSDNTYGEKRRFYLAIDIVKTKSIVNDKGKRTYNYNIIWIIKDLGSEEDLNKEIMFLAKYECVNENIKKLLFEFINNLSNRRKIDKEFYLELLFIDQFLEKNWIQIVDSDEKEYKILTNLKKKMREMLKDKELNNRIIAGGYRGWRKKITNAIWKNEILNSEKLNDLFMYNFKKEFDWKSTLEFVKQPTYNVLYKRNTNKIENDWCKRCGKEAKEDWEHIWLCEDNEFTINEINSRKLIILRGKSKIWVRGVYNEKFNSLTNKKEEKVLIKKLWNFTYDEIKKRIWIPRCEEIKRLEDKVNIQKLDLRKKRERLNEKLEDGTEKIKKIKTEENIEKLNKKDLIKKLV
ncbi:hypothetical protein RhiirB3_441412 [Rhizophagus irregularis]|nr:hypothetical protein RhiirB3_441412 [Rhizophagus irregularis]